MNDRQKKFINGFIDAAFFSTKIDLTNFLEDKYSKKDLAPGTLKKIEKDCFSFFNKYGSYFQGKENQAGVDFWFTRNSNNYTFEEASWAKAGKILTAGAAKYKKIELFPDDDGLIYFEEFDYD